MFILCASIIRWYFIWLDISQAVLGVGLGLLVIILSYVYNWMRHIDYELDKQEKRIDATVDWWMNREKESIREVMEGK